MEVVLAEEQVFFSEAPDRTAERSQFEFWDFSGGVGSVRESKKKRVQ